MTVEPHAVENLINRFTNCLSSLTYCVASLVCSQLAYDKQRLMSDK